MTLCTWQVSSCQASRSLDTSLLEPKHASFGATSAMCARQRLHGGRWAAGCMSSSLLVHIGSESSHVLQGVAAQLIDHAAAHAASAGELAQSPHALRVALPQPW